MSSDPRKLSFRQQLKENNQKFKNEMKANNSKFKTDLKNPQPLTDKSKRFIKNVGIILLLIFLYPVGLFVMLKKSNWSKKSKAISIGLGGAFFALMAVAIINAPPTATLDNLKIDGNQSVRGNAFTILGSVYPTDSIMEVNGIAVKIDSQGKFKYSVPLNEGDNDITVVAKKDDKQSTATYKIYRYTNAEVLAQEKAAAKKAADEAAAAAKKKADDAKTEQAKQQQAAKDKAKSDAEAAVAKAKADAIASAKAAKAKAAADAAAKAASVTVSQKNALRKAQSYLGYAAFSHDGLVDQLVYEQFSVSDATYGADNVGVSWDEQAAKKAKSYMGYSSFSRGSLIDQLMYDKFTLEQATYGANAVGL